ncbi:transposase, partial [Acidocella aquatica]|uniref:transposase n=1 Tax=Acidocella aquatica TaxID=1922313 RepID=UPI0038D0C1CD
RPLMAFVMVLSHSRQIFLRFCLDARMENFLRGHAGAFTAWGGVPRVLLYDNLKSAVLERRGDAIRFHPTLLHFAGHYRYEPRPVAVARGNEKGRVERAIRYIRDAFFAARKFKDIDDLNAQAEAWCNGAAADRPCPEDPQQTVRAVFAQEIPRLLPLPDNPAPLLERVEVSVGKTPYVRFDLNDYSVPHGQVQRILTVLADPHQLRILDGTEVLARHPRSYDKGAQIEDAAHLQALIDDKRAAHQHRAIDRLAHAAPASQILLARAAEHGANLGAITAALLRLLERNTAADLEAAILEALARDVPHANAVRLALERRRAQRGDDPPVAVVMPAHVQARDTLVQPHPLETYDQLAGVHEDAKPKDD